MSSVIVFLLPWILIFLPVLAMGGLGFYINRRISSRKAPVGEKMVRPAGESLRKELEDESFKIMNCLFWLALIPLLIGNIMAFQPDFPVWLKGILFIAGTLSMAWGVRMFRLLLRKVYNYSLGFRGERFVGGLLENLREHGYRVFHDLPFENFNIDHAVVGPAGVFAIETKTRRKNLSKEGAKGKVTKVLFDGRVLQFPEWSDSHGVQQACNNARHLSTRLSAATGEKVRVDPILVLPGWWVESTTNQPLLVLNPKQVLTALPRRERKLSPSQIQRIAYQLERMGEMAF